MDDKARLRIQVRRRRADRSPEEREQAAQALARVVASAAALQDAVRVACYVSAAGEPGTAPLVEALRRSGTEVLLPVVAGSLLDWALDDGTTAPGPWGLHEPTGPRLGPDALGTCDVLVVPALAVDGSGTRLGQGGGYYDRCLGRLDRSHHPSRVVALVHDDELLAAGTLPVQPHDVPVDAAATPNAWVDLGPRGLSPRGAASARAPRPPRPPHG